MRTFRWHLLTLTSALVFAACGDDGGPTDTGTAPDSGVVTDTGVETDTGTAPDTGVDSGVVADAGQDAGVDVGVDTGPPGQGIVILHTNDEQSHQLAYAPNIDDYPTAAAPGSGIIGGLKRKATKLIELRNQAPDTALLLQGGDMMMGTFFHVANLFFGVDLMPMSLLGYNAVTFGNHEFDFGPGTLASAIRTGSLAGTTPTMFDKPIVASNIRFSIEDTADDGLEALYGDVANGQPIVRTYVEDHGDLRVGYFGMMGLDAALVVPFKQPVRFSLAQNLAMACTSNAECPGSECLPTAEAPTAKAGFCAVNTDESDVATHFPQLVADAASAISDLRAQNVDLVVMLSHIGVNERELSSLEMMGMSPADAVVSEEIVLAKALDNALAGAPGIDLIVGGHSHTALQTPLTIPMPMGGHNTYIVQAGAYTKYVGKVRLTRPTPADNWELDTQYSGLEIVDDNVSPNSGFEVVANLLIAQTINGLEDTGAAQGGDDLIFPGEQCDGAELPNGGNCAGLIPDMSAGTLACHANRQLDLSSCQFFGSKSFCGDNSAEDLEQCDGTDLNNLTCAQIQGNYTGGTLGCAANCTYDVSGCDVRFPSLLEIVANFGRDLADPAALDYTTVNDPSVAGDVWFAELGTTAFDVGDKVPYNESNLANLVGDASRWAINILGGQEFVTDPVRVVITANGVLRDGLYAGQTGALTVGDLFRVVPLGVSPAEQTPGYPMIDFWLAAPEIKAGVEIGLSAGLESGAFWLNASGIQVEYDMSLPAFDPADPVNTGRVTKLTLTSTDALPWEDSRFENVVLYDVDRLNGAPPNPYPDPNRLVHVATSFYAGLFIEGFGLCPRDNTGAQLDECKSCTNDTECRQDLTCDQTAGRCRGGVPAPIRLRSLVPSNSQEIKQFLSLLTYVRHLPGNATLPAEYNTATPRRYCCVGTACPADNSRTCQ